MTEYIPRTPSKRVTNLTAISLEATGLVEEKLPTGKANRWLATQGGGKAPARAANVKWWWWTQRARL